MAGKLMNFFKMLLAKEPQELMPKEPEDLHFHPKLTKLVEAAGARVRTSSDRLGEEIEKAIQENVLIRKGKWDSSNDGQK